MPTEEILAPDAELAMVTYLRERFAALLPAPDYAQDLVIGRRYPAATNPGVYITVTRSGGTMVNLVEDAARIDFRVWHPDALAGMRLAQKARAMVYAGRNGIVTDPNLDTPVRIGQVVEFLGPGRFPDPLNPEREIILFTLELRLRSTT